GRGGRGGRVVEGFVAERGAALCAGGGGVVDLGLLDGVGLGQGAGCGRWWGRPAAPASSLWATAAPEPTMSRCFATGPTLPTVSNRLLQGYFGSNTLRFRVEVTATLPSCSLVPGRPGSSRLAVRGLTNGSSRRLCGSTIRRSRSPERTAVSGWLPKVSA